MEAWGEENVLSLCRALEISLEYASGKRQGFTRAEGPGRPRDARTMENVDAVKNLKENDQTISVSALSEITE